MNMRFIPSRRDVLKSGGALIVSFSFADAIGEALAQGGTKPLALTEVDAFLAIDAQGLVTVYSGKVDLGTGVSTALSQIVADELDVPLSRIKLIQGDTALTPDQGTTWASLTVQLGGMQLRNAAATARIALFEEASKRLGVKPEDLKVADGVVGGGGKSVSYGELIGSKMFSLKLDHAKPAKSKDPKDYKLVGRPIARADIAEKVMATFTYMHDFRVPGMVHGRVVRPPAIGAKLESVDEASIKNIPGIIKVVRERDFLAVVAENEWAAIKGARELKAVWSKAEMLPEQSKLWEHVRNSKIVNDEVTSNVGNTAEAMGKDGVKTVDIRLRDPAARLDRAVLRGRRAQGRQADLVVGLAGDPQSEKTAGADVRHVARRRPLHLR
jgi:nicotinate dehydrogenase subunit B